MPRKTRRTQKAESKEAVPDKGVAVGAGDAVDAAEVKEEPIEQLYDDDLPDYERVRLENIRRNQGISSLHALHWLLSPFINLICRIHAIFGFELAKIRSRRS